MTYAPITLFVYNRPWHTQQTIESLKQNQFAADCDLLIYSDAPKYHGAVLGVQEVRKYIHSVSGFRSVTVIERDENYGLAKSIISGVSEVVAKYGRIIVLEDDMITSPHFLLYMNEALSFYQDVNKVISIHGYTYPVKMQLPETFFLRGADCWGWATWKRGWDLFEHDGRKLLSELRSRKLTYKFDFDGTYLFTRILEGHLKGEIDSWAIRWYASAFLNDRLTLYPGRSLVQNIGIDESGTHCHATNEFETELTHVPIRIEKLPLEENQTARKAFKKFFRVLQPSIGKRALKKIIRMMCGNK